MKRLAVTVMGIRSHSLINRPRFRSTTISFLEIYVQEHSGSWFSRARQYTYCP